MRDHPRRFEQLELQASGHARAAASASEALHAARSALTLGSHASLVFRIGARSARVLSMRSALRGWRDAAQLLIAAEANAAMQQAVKAAKEEGQVRRASALQYHT